MIRRCQLLAVLAATLLTSGALADDKRNPFGKTDVPDPFDDQVMEFFKSKVGELKGDDKDLNALDWVKKETAGKPGALDGDWGSRWNGGVSGGGWTEGTAKIKTVKVKVGDKDEERYYILYEDFQFKGLVEARAEGKDDKGRTRLVGKYLSLNNTDNFSTHVFAGLIVSDTRIDGLWDEGRFDFKRVLKK